MTTVALILALFVIAFEALIINILASIIYKQQCLVRSAEALIKEWEKLRATMDKEERKDSK
jgi:hypothetical protein